MIVVGLSAMLAHLYWCFMRYLHLKECNEIEQAPAFDGEAKRRWSIAGNSFPY